MDSWNAFRPGRFATESLQRWGSSSVDAYFRGQRSIGAAYVVFQGAAQNGSHLPTQSGVSGDARRHSTSKPAYWPTPQAPVARSFHVPLLEEPSTHSPRTIAEARGRLPLPPRTQSGSVKLRPAASPTSRWNQTFSSLQPYKVPLKYIMNTSAKMRRKSINTRSSTPSSFMELKMASTMFLRASARLSTRSGRKARRMRRVFNSGGMPPTNPRIDTFTTMKSSQFQPQPELHK
mmetsp:Transcript_22481/g.67359  ORF Transcript_22481/g.67359 Transcript_22481/m.67359 type:complete len:233 (-) Transcript_22481:416-1114(-)